MVVDACMSGLAVGCRQVGSSESQSLGTYNERWRFVAERELRDSQPRRRDLNIWGYRVLRRWLMYNCWNLSM
eukprot:2155892-Amphidinium_carterae.1